MLYKMPDDKLEHFSYRQVWTVSQPQNVAFDIELSPLLLDLDRNASGRELFCALESFAPWDVLRPGILSVLVFCRNGL
jgi:hypothetical protein